MTASKEGDYLSHIAFGFGSHEVSISTSTEFPTIEYTWLFWSSLAVAAAFSALAAPRILLLAVSSSVSRAPAYMLVSKVTVAVILAGLKLGLLVTALRQKVEYQSTRLFASASVELVASCLLLALSPIEHLKRHRPSILASLFLSLHLVVDVVRCPTLWNDVPFHSGSTSYVAFTGLFTASIIAELTMLALESIQRGRWLDWKSTDHSPEETSGFLSLGFYSWLNRLLWRGYYRPLTMERLYPLDSSIAVKDGKPQSPRTLHETPTGTSTWDIIIWISKPLLRSLMLPILPRLCLLGFTFCQPFFIQRLLRFLSSDNQEDDEYTVSGLVTIAIVTYFGIAMSTALYWYYQERFQTQLRGFLISAIYQKTIHLTKNDTAAVTLMGVDVERIYTGIRLIHEVWSNLIQIALAAWLLKAQIGLAFLAPLLIVAMSFAASFVLSRYAAKYQGVWMARVQKRTSTTSAILSLVKDLRVNGMTRPAIGLVQNEREDEIKVGEQSRTITAISASVSQLPQAIVPALAFAFGPKVLTETRAFTALSFISLLTAPLLVVLQSIPIIVACMACLRRIKNFLAIDDRVDTRTVAETTVGCEKGGKDGGDVVTVIHADFGWSSDSEPVLKDISLALTRSSTTFVIGPVGSGKSTLCRALLGEVPHATGRTVFNSNKTAFCDQTPFLFNASIASNIIGFAQYDERRYNEVMCATMLWDDINRLPSKDQTVIGSKGVSLSGGQRQRLCLARALYHDAEVLILDDVFSGLDGSTQAKVCQRVFGPAGLLRRRGTTTLVCTHSTELLPAADYIIALSAGGSVREQGSTRKFFEDRTRLERIGIEGKSSLFASATYQSNQVVDDIVVEDNRESDMVRDKRLKAPSGPIQSVDIPPTCLDLVVYRHWLSTIGVLPLLIYVMLIAGIGFSTNSPTIWLKYWSEDSTSVAPEHSFAFWIGIYAFIGASTLLFVLPAGLIMLRTAVRLTGTDLHRTTIYTAMYSSLRYLSTTDVGKVLNLFSQDMNILDTQLPRMVNNMCICISMAVGQAVVIAASSAWLAISYPLFGTILWAVQRIYLPTSKRLRILDLEAKTPLYTNFLDTLSGLSTIRAFGWFPDLVSRNNHLLDDSQRPLYLLAMAQQWLTLTMNIIVALLAIILVSLATKLNLNSGNIGAGLVTLITLSSTLTNIIVAYTGLETCLGAVSRLKSFKDDTEQENLPGEDYVPSQSWPSKGCVALRQVQASYDGVGKVLDGVDMTIQPAQKVAICGRTGSGKSSILAILLRLLNPVASATETEHAPVVVDDVPLHLIDRSILRERIIAASQDSVFFPDGTTWKLNLDPLSSASEEECKEVLTDLSLSNLVESSGGMDAQINFSELSSGQKQLFSLARAVLRRRVKQRTTQIDGGLLLLDEITSNADTNTEKRVMEILDQEFRHYTVIMVTHRREMALTCDRILVVDAGKVVEDGEPQKLMDQESGWFKELWTYED